MIEGLEIETLEQFRWGKLEKLEDWEKSVLFWIHHLDLYSTHPLLSPR